MPRLRYRLSDTTIKAKDLVPGRHADGGNLYLSVGRNGTKSWVFMYDFGKKRREMGMGRYPEITLSAARKKAEEARTHLANGNDPLIEKRKADPLWSEVVEDFLEAKSPEWKNPKHRDQWRMTLTTYCAPIMDKKISSVTTEDVVDILKPIWLEKHETARRLRGRMEKVIVFAKIKGWFHRENPAIWRNHLAGVLPKLPKGTQENHAAMSGKDAPAFFAKLRGSSALSSQALVLTILSAKRTNEVLEAKWKEFDLDQGLWKIPGERMKSGRDHDCPLSKVALAMLRELKKTATSEFVFPGAKKGKPLSNMSMTMALRRNYEGVATVHGFRSTFRDWAGDDTEFPREVIEAQLAHIIGDKAEAAYRRKTALAKRRQLVEAWDRFLCGEVAENVVTLAA